MLLFYYAVIFSSLFFRPHSADQVAKPNFAPYCTTKNICTSSCLCKIAPNCKILEMDEDSRKTVEFYHNQLRQIQSIGEPRAAGLVELMYDTELEQLSKCRVAACDSEYSECYITNTYPETAQVAGQITKKEGEPISNIFWIQIVNSWMVQTNYLTVETIHSFPGGEVGEKLHHYAQIMSDRLRALGCAWAESGEIVTMVCTYGPRGPIQGDPIYIPGPTCSRCPAGYKCTNREPFRNLCRRIEQHTTQSSTIRDCVPPSPPPFPPRPQNKCKYQMSPSVAKEDDRTEMESFGTESMSKDWGAQVGVSNGKYNRSRTTFMEEINLLLSSETRDREPLTEPLLPFTSILRKISSSTPTTASNIPRMERRMATGSDDLKLSPTASRSSIIIHDPFVIDELKQNSKKRKSQVKKKRTNSRLRGRERYAVDKTMSNVFGSHNLLLLISILFVFLFHYVGFN